MKKSKKYLIALVIALLVSIPLYSKYTSGLTCDLTYHLTRIEGIKQSLQAHIFPAYIYPYANNGFGYAAPLFYPDIFLLIPAFFLLFRCSYITVIQVFYIYNQLFYSFICLYIICLYI